MKPRDRWFRYLMLPALLVVASLMTACDRSGGVVSQSGLPKIAVTTDAVDFGRIPVGQKVSHTYSVKNVGGAPLNIKEVKLDLVEGC